MTPECPYCKKKDAWYESPIGDTRGNYLRKIVHIQECGMKRIENIEKRLLNLEKMIEEIK